MIHSLYILHLKKKSSIDSYGIITSVVLGHKKSLIQGTLVSEGTLCIIQNVSHLHDFK